MSWLRALPNTLVTPPVNQSQNMGAAISATQRNISSDGTGIVQLVQKRCMPLNTRLIYLGFGCFNHFHLQVQHRRWGSQCPFEKRWSRFTRDGSLNLSTIIYIPELSYLQLFKIPKWTYLYFCKCACKSIYSKRVRDVYLLQCPFPC